MDSCHDSDVDLNSVSGQSDGHDTKRETKPGFSSGCESSERVKVSIVLAEQCIPSYVQRGDSLEIGWEAQQGRSGTALRVLGGIQSTSRLRKHDGCACMIVTDACIHYVEAWGRNTPRVLKGNRDH